MPTYRYLGRTMVRRILQEDSTGCGLACVAMVAGTSYAKVKAIAIRLGIAGERPPYYTSAKNLSMLMRELGLRSSKERMLSDWKAFSSPSIVGINFNEKHRTWHWVVYVPSADGGYVLDPKKVIKSARRTDFSRMRPRSYIPMLRAAR